MCAASKFFPACNLVPALSIPPGLTSTLLQRGCAPQQSCSQSSPNLGLERWYRIAGSPTEWLQLSRTRASSRWSRRCCRQARRRRSPLPPLPATACGCSRRAHNTASLACQERPPSAPTPSADQLLDPPFLKDDGSPVTQADVRAVESAEARAHGGHVPKGGFTAAVQVPDRAAKRCQPALPNAADSTAAAPWRLLMQQEALAPATISVALLLLCRRRRRPTSRLGSLLNPLRGRCWRRCSSCTLRQVGALGRGDPAGIAGRMLAACSHYDGTLSHISATLASNLQQQSHCPDHVLLPPPLPLLPHARTTCRGAA
jgi:hypothetical protein